MYFQNVYLRATSRPKRIQKTKKINTRMNRERHGACCALERRRRRRQNEYQYFVIRVPEWLSSISYATAVAARPCACESHAQVGTGMKLSPFSTADDAKIRKICSARFREPRRVVNRDIIASRTSGTKNANFFLRSSFFRLPPITTPPRERRPPAATPQWP